MVQLTAFLFLERIVAKYLNVGIIGDKDAFSIEFEGLTETSGSSLTKVKMSVPELCLRLK